MAVETRVEALGGVAGIIADVSGSFDGLNSVDVARAIEAAAALCCRFAPDAPDAILREAIARCSGWLIQTPSGSYTSVSTGPRQTDYAPGQLSALRHSGAMSLLSPWKVRRGGAI